jgi:hypothetical protein
LLRNSGTIDGRTTKPFPISRTTVYLARAVALQSSDVHWHIVFSMEDGDL